VAPRGVFECHFLCKYTVRDSEIPHLIGCKDFFRVKGGGGSGFLNNFRSENLKVRDYMENLDAGGDAVKVCEGVVWVSDLA
jgi:hypothetical protein